MKLITSEERQAHIKALTSDGLRGMVYGALFSAGLFGYMKLRHPAKFSSFNASIKTCLVIMPTITVCAFWADQGSVDFDKKMHVLGGKERIIEENRDWESKSILEKTKWALHDNRYSILNTSWATAMYLIWYQSGGAKFSLKPMGSKTNILYASATGVFGLVYALLHSFD
ncbi:Piso0_001704 [Millerozyma farinosa CBS 7064]|uniref:Piso0_001704 protein n=1 Tax=Pichia sorbitophila (strain ATCC MYA-4447 / BCRC 22081 / CBS 7064 / NBRC 10061 / NRRL Y-12695) TaxID=559304 RepID=G8YLI0_PICSO|nr:Piso0_001704 [Millerozyma farinosa CBS 7064]